MNSRVVIRKVLWLYRKLHNKGECEVTFKVYYPQSVWRMQIGEYTTTAMSQQKALVLMYQELLREYKQKFS